MGKEVKILGVRHSIEYFPAVKRVLGPLLEKGMLVAVEGYSNLVTITSETAFPAGIGFFNEVVKLCRKKKARVTSLKKGFRQRFQTKTNRETYLGELIGAKKALKYKQNETAIEQRLKELRGIASVKNSREFRKLADLKATYLTTLNKYKKYNASLEFLTALVEVTEKLASKSAEAFFAETFPIREQHWEKIIETEKPDIIVVGSAHLPSVQKIVAKLGFTPRIVLGPKKQRKHFRKMARKAYFKRKGEWSRQPPKPRKPRK